MKISKAGIQLIKEFEGYSPIPYKDVAGLNTIGYGHLIKKGELFSRVTAEQAEELLLKDLATAEKGVNTLIIVKLTQNQYDALVSFTYNVGVGALRDSTLRKYLNSPADMKMLLTSS